MMEIAELHGGRADICREILDDLPEWLGLPEAKAAYIAASEKLPMLVGHAEGQLAGFISLKRYTSFAAEEFPTLWTAANPCLLMLKPIA